MPMYEQFGDFGTAGLLGWQYSGMTGTLGTVGGGTEDTYWALTGWTGGTAGTAQVAYMRGDAAPWSGSVWTWKQWSGGASQAHVILADNGSGTELGFCCRKGKYLHWALYNSTTGSVISALDNTTGTDASVWADVTVTYAGAGTWTAVYTSNNGTGTSTFPGAYAAPWNPAFVRGSTWYPKIRGYNDVNGGPDGIARVMFPLESPKSILDYIGTFRNGSHWGEVPWGSYVMSVGDCMEKAFEPGNSRGWVSAVPVTVDDAVSNLYSTTLGLWSYAFNAYSDASPMIYDGTFFVRQTWDSGTNWTTLMTGFLTPDQVDYDYGNRTLTANIRSMLGKAALSTVPMDKVYMGTVSAISDGTVTVEGTRGSFPTESGATAYANVHSNEFLWDGTGTEAMSIRIDDVIDAGTWSGGGTVWETSFYVRTAPDWMTLNGPLWWTISEYRLAGPLAFNTAPDPSTYIEAAAGKMGLTVNPRFLSATAPWIDLYNFGEDAVLYYGGEKWVDCLHDMTESVGLSYSIDGTGRFNAVPMSPDLASIEGTLNFNTAINHDQWTYGWVQPVNSITIDTGWDREDGRFKSQAFEESATGSYYGGDAVKLSAPWLADDSGQVLAQRHMWSYGMPRLRMSLVYEGSTYDDYTTGRLWTVDNLPTVVPAPTINAWIVASKTYNYDEDIVTLDLVNARITNVWIWDDSTWDGGDVWW